MSLSFRYRAPAERRKEFFLDRGPRAEWQLHRQVFSRPEVAGQPPLYEFDHDGMTWFKGDDRNTRRTKNPTVLDRIFGSFMSAGKPGLAALTLILGMEWQIPDEARKPAGTRLANRTEIFTEWLRRLEEGERAGLAREGFALTPETIFRLATGELALKIQGSESFGDNYIATREIAACRFKKPDTRNFGGIDPFSVSELSAYYFADAGLAGLERQEPEAALAAFRLAEVIVPVHSVIGKRLIAEQIKAGRVKF